LLIGLAAEIGLGKPQPALYGLLAGMKGVSQVISRGDPLPDFTWQCPLLSLPLAFGTELETIPANVPYLFPDPMKTEEWQRRLAGDRLRIGLAWAGNPKHPRDHIRSIALERLIPLMGARHYFLFFAVWPRRGATRITAGGSALDRSSGGIERLY
jgi:hypothetical protein